MVDVVLFTRGKKTIKQEGKKERKKGKTNMMMEPVGGKTASKRKITLEQWVHAMKALDGGCACRNVAL